MNEVIASGRLTMGEKTLLCEKEMARFLGSRFCIMVNSGSSANLLAVASLLYTRERPLVRGDEVIVPAVSWATTYTPLYQYGLKLRFVDVHMGSFNIDPARLEEAVTEKTKALFAVNLLGNPNDFDALEAICQKYSLVLLEDNCESLGATFRGRQTGTFGRVGTFSTFFSHHISTMEGGFVATDDEEIYHILLSLRSHGWTRQLPSENLVTGKKHHDPFEESFKFVLPGYNLRPIELSAAVGIEQLRKLPRFIEVRRDNARLFRRKMEKFEDLFYFQEEIGEGSFFGFPFVLKNAKREDRSALVSYLSERGIETRPIISGNFVNQPVVKYFDRSVHGDLANAEKIHDLGIFVGNHHYPLDGQLNNLTEALENWVS